MYIQVIRITDGPMDGPMERMLLDVASAFGGPTERVTTPQVTDSPQLALPYTPTNMTAVCKAWPDYKFRSFRVEIPTPQLGALAAQPWPDKEPASAAVRAILRIQQVLPYYYAGKPDADGTKVDEEAYLSDMLADLLHYIYSRRLNVADALSRAEEHYNEERMDFTASTRVVSQMVLTVIVTEDVVDTLLITGCAPSRKYLRDTLLRACGTPAWDVAAPDTSVGNMLLPFQVRDTDPHNVEAVRRSLETQVQNALWDIMAGTMLVDDAGKE